MTIRLIRVCLAIHFTLCYVSIVQAIQVNNGLNPAQPNQTRSSQTQSSQQAPAGKVDQTISEAVGPRMAPQRPFPPHDAKMQQYINQLLMYWENSSSQIRLYQCDFRRWEYDTQLCNWRDPTNNHLAAKTVSEGQIRYAAPDKGMYKVTRKWHFAGPPKEEGGTPQYSQRGDEKEEWICDGSSIYEYDYVNKRLYDLELPPESQGQGLKNSPLPFVFGAKAQELLDRYWVRDVTPANVEDQYWLEAWPKRINDAQAYKKVEIILSRKPFLPKSIHIYAPNYDEKKNPTKMAFVFENLKINEPLDSVANFFGVFVRPNTPFGWKRIEKKLITDPAQTQIPKMGQMPNGDNAK